MAADQDFETFNDLKKKQPQIFTGYFYHGSTYSENDEL